MPGSREVSRRRRGGLRAALLAAHAQATVVFADALAVSQIVKVAPVAFRDTRSMVVVGPGLV